MDRSVETIIRERGAEMRPGDVYMLNAPYNGGTHLPDITVVTPVFDDAGSEVLFYVASRGHHEDIGGLTPGSMTPRATTIEEEGVYIDNVKLVDEGRFLEAETRALLTGAKYPARQPDKNIADLKAQVAANAKGEAELSAHGRALRARRGARLHGPRAGQRRGERAPAAGAARRRALPRRDGPGHGASRCASPSTASSARPRSTSPARARSSRTNFNAPEPVTRAAVLYTFRVMVDEPIPMNAGCLKPIEIVIPEGSMLRPAYPAAVVAGNVEISQIVTNALFAALDALGSAQGTMNNLTFGNEQLQYYETLCSGAPAGPGFDGAAAVHVHMTNTRLTDPEILELRYPVLLEEFSIRRGSGGKGKWSSGDGTRRVIRFLERMDCAILSGYRECAPSGSTAASRARRAPTLVRRTDGSLERLQGCDADRDRGRRGDHHRHADGRRLRRGVKLIAPLQRHLWRQGHSPPTFGELTRCAPCQSAAPRFHMQWTPTTKATDNKMKTTDAARTSLGSALDPGGSAELQLPRRGGDRARVAGRRHDGARDHLGAVQGQARRAGRSIPSTTSPISICRG